MKIYFEKSIFLIDMWIVEEKWFGKLSDNMILKPRYVLLILYIFILKNYILKNFLLYLSYNFRNKILR